MALNLPCKIIQVYLPDVPLVFSEEDLPLCAFSLYASIARYSTSLLFFPSLLYLSTRIDINKSSVTKELWTQSLWIIQKIPGQERDVYEGTIDRISLTSW